MPCWPHASAADTPFLTYEWQKTWADCLCSCEGELHLMTVQRDGGALIGLAPLFLLSEPDTAGHPQRLLRLIGSVDASDYLDLIAVRGRERECSAAMLDVLAQATDSDASIFSSWNVPEASLTRALLPELEPPQRGWTLLDEKQVARPNIQLPTTVDDYVQSLDKERHELRRGLASGRGDRRRDMVCHHQGRSHA